MALSEEQIELQHKIDRYLRGELSGKDKHDFESQIAGDPKLQKEVKINKALMFLIESKKHKALKDQVMKTTEVVTKMRERVKLNYEVDSEMQEVTDLTQRAEPGKGFPNNLIEQVGKWVDLLFPKTPAYRLAMVAAILLILFLPSYFLFLSPANLETLYADNYNAYPDVISTQSRYQEDADELSALMTEYESRNFQTFLIEADKFLKAHPDKQELIFYRGIANLELNNPQKAAADFEIAMSFNNKLAEAAEWYLALSFIKAGKKKKPEEILKNIIDRNNQFSERARKLKRRLR